MLKPIIHTFFLVAALLPVGTRAQAACDQIGKGVTLCAEGLPLTRVQRTADNNGWIYSAPSPSGPPITVNVSVHDLPQWEQVVQADALVEATLNTVRQAGISQDNLALLLQDKAQITNQRIFADRLAIAFVINGQTSVSMRTLYIGPGYALLITSDVPGASVSDTLQAVNAAILQNIVLPAAPEQAPCKPLPFGISFCADNIPLITVSDSVEDGYLVSRGDAYADVFIIPEDASGVTQAQLHRVLDRQTAESYNKTVDELEFIVQGQMPMGRKTADVSTYVVPSSIFPKVKTTAFYLGEGFLLFVTAENEGTTLTDDHISLFNEIMANLRIPE